MSTHETEGESVARPAASIVPLLVLINSGTLWGCGCDCCSFVYKHIVDAAHAKIMFSCLVFIYRSIISVNCVNSAYCTPSASLASRLFLLKFILFLCVRVGRLVGVKRSACLCDCRRRFHASFRMHTFRFSESKEFHQ